MQVSAVRRGLLAWYARAGRDLPWRRSRDPYLVWVSEVMLQQTQVERVKDYFTRFTARFPTVADLARAREAEVLKCWEGLGYYRRARQLHAAAKAVVTEHGGRFPRTVAGLRGLPGVGRYTAGAIASIAFDVRAPIVEANSRRVIARLAGHDQPVGGAGDEPIWELAARLVPEAKPGRFNQALMDLGATICTPDRPACSRCPVAGSCAARRQDRVAEIPVLPVPAAIRRLRETALVVRHAGRVLVERRGPGDWWEGLWDFPRAERGVRTGGRRLATIVYSVTNHRVTCAVVDVRPRRPPSATAGQRWVATRSLAGMAMTAPGRRIARLAAAAC